MAVVLYGATGFTGRLVTRELVRRGVEFTLAGRSGDKLAQLSREDGDGARTVAAAIDDPPALRRCFDGCDVLINCAGPFTHFGEPVLRAAIDAGVHYVDSTGEQTWMRTVFERYGAEAERKGIALIPACGFDYVPGDLIARLVADGIEPLEEMALYYGVSGLGVTRGTLLSTLEMLKGGDVEYVNGDWRPSARVGRERFAFPGPMGERTVGFYPSGEHLTVPRHTRTRRVKTRLTTGTIAPGPLAEAVPYAMPVFSLALRTPLKDLIGKLVPRLPEGPGEETRMGNRFTIVAIARSEDGSERTGIVRGSDPYGLTAVTLVHAAELLAAAGYDRAGPMGPGAAFEPAQFLDYLGDHGVSWERPLAPVTV
jgi:short subunit dehydrogenase-like uncharacterized protein